MENEIDIKNNAIEDDVQKRLNLKIMFFSDPGVGKTTAIASSYDDPRLAPMLWIDLERSQSAINSKVEPYTIQDLKNNRPPIKGKISYLKISSKQELEDIISALEKRSSSKYESPSAELNVYLKSKEFKPYLGFRTIVVDNLTEVSRIYLQDSVIVGGKSPDKILPTLQDFGRRIFTVGDVVRELRDIDTHIILTAHAEVRENIVREETISPDLGSVKLAKDVSGLIPISGYIRVNPKDNNTREILFQPITGLIGVKDNLEKSSVGNSQVFEKKDKVLSKLFDLWHIEK